MLVPSRQWYWRTSPRQCPIQTPKQVSESFALMSLESSNEWTSPVPRQVMVLFTNSEFSAPYPSKVYVNESPCEKRLLFST